MNILEALANLDPDNDVHWTNNGLPRLDVLRVLTNNDALSRQEVTDANPEFIRQPKEPEPTELLPSDTDHNPMDAEVMVEAEEPSETSVELAKVETFADGSPGDEEIEIADLAPVPMTEIEKLQALATEKEAELLQAQKDNDAAKINADRLANEVTAINANIEHLTPWNRHGQTAGIKDYIASQNDLRLQRADRMNKFIAATGGATPGQLRKALDARSALDVAMAGRKPARGARRPEVRVPSAGL